MNQRQATTCCQHPRAGLWSGMMKAVPLLVLLAVPGCAPDSAGAAGTAEDFKQAIAAGDMSVACSKLTPRLREKTAAKSTCEDQMGSLQLSAGGAVLRTHSYGRNALVEFENDAVFLAAAGSGWQVTGAGCTLRGDSSYDCEVGG